MLNTIFIRESVLPGDCTRCGAVRAGTLLPLRFVQLATGQRHVAFLQFKHTSIISQVVKIIP